MKHAIWISVLLLIVLHQDFWNWHRADIVLGFVPYTLAYQVFVSILTAIVWVVVVIYGWPKHVDDIKPLNRTRPAHPQSGRSNRT